MTLFEIYWLYAPRVARHARRHYQELRSGPDYLDFPLIPQKFSHLFAHIKYFYYLCARKGLYPPILARFLLCKDIIKGVY